jgi:hypothetical protein
MDGPTWHSDYFDGGLGRNGWDADEQLAERMTYTREAVGRRSHE